eukprot:scaffold121952_cov46-Tisochrysis_lutea.AAC.1
MHAQVGRLRAVSFGSPNVYKVTSCETSSMCTRGTSVQVVGSQHEEAYSRDELLVSGVGNACELALRKQPSRDSMSDRRVEMQLSRHPRDKRMPDELCASARC